jgi:acyl-[acyl-carrier-protein] desaturase
MNSAKLILDITRQLEPVVENEMNRHNSVSKMWYPHEYIPWDLGSNFSRMGGKDFDESQSKLSKVVQDSLLMSLLGEDNLPAYHTELTYAFDKDGPWRTWVDLWSADENRHSIALRDYIVTTRVLDPKKLENLRLEHMKKRFKIPSYKNDMIHTIVYTTIQELGTRVIHKHTAKITNEPIGEALMARIAMDENLHFIVYRNLVKAALEINPDVGMEAISNVIIGFDFPQHQLPGYREMGNALAFAEIYDPSIHLDEVIYPILKYWDVENLILSGTGDHYRNALYAFLNQTRKSANRFIQIKQEHDSNMSSTSAALF